MGAGHWSARPPTPRMVARAQHTCAHDRPAAASVVPLRPRHASRVQYLTAWRPASIPSPRETVGMGYSSSAGDQLGAAATALLVRGAEVSRRRSGRRRISCARRPLGRHGAASRRSFLTSHRLCGCTNSTIPGRARPRGRPDYRNRGIGLVRLGAGAQMRAIASVGGFALRGPPVARPGSDVRTWPGSYAESVRPLAS